MSFHPEILAPEQKRVLLALGPHVTSMGFYLGGGTALALRLGHRRSMDLDWFRDAPIPDTLGLAARLRGAGASLDIRSTAAGTLHGVVAGVRVSLFEYRYAPLTPATASEEMGCRIASLLDLACMKLAAAAQRGSRKDLVDLASLLEHLSLAEMLSAYRRRYGLSDVSHVLYGLVYFDDAEAEPEPDGLHTQPWSTVKERLSAAVAAHAAGS